MTSNTEELRTGFGSWLQRQPEWSEAGKLAEALRDDLAQAGRSEWPSTFREVREWALSPSPRPPRTAQWLTAAYVLWREWLREIVYEHSGPPLDSRGKPMDNPFARVKA